ncbi:hypothetical protein CU098_006464, partial [Rhizopus stolonifer]
KTMTIIGAVSVYVAVDITLILPNPPKTTTICTRIEKSKQGLSFLKQYCVQRTKMGEAQECYHNL